MYATSAAALELGLDVNADTLVCVAPGVPTPCRAEVSVVLLGATAGSGAADIVLGGACKGGFFGASSPPPSETNAAPPP
jgi:hypothetical protein